MRLIQVWPVAQGAGAMRVRRRAGHQLRRHHHAPAALWLQQLQVHTPEDAGAQQDNSFQALLKAVVWPLRSNDPHSPQVWWADSAKRAWQADHERGVCAGGPRGLLPRMPVATRGPPGCVRRPELLLWPRRVRAWCVRDQPSGMRCLHKRSKDRLNHAVGRRRVRVPARLCGRRLLQRGARHRVTACYAAAAQESPHPVTQHGLGAFQGQRHLSPGTSYVELPGCLYCGAQCATKVPTSPCPAVGRGRPTVVGGDADRAGRLRGVRRSRRRRQPHRPHLPAPHPG